MGVWETVKLGEVLKRTDRFELRQNEQDYIFTGIYSFSKGLFVKPPVSGNSFKLPKIQKLKEGDFIYSKIMAWEGAFALVRKESDNTVISGASVVYEVDKKHLLPKFIDYQFKLKSVWMELGSKSTGTNMRRRSLHPDQFEQFKIKIPPIDQQRTIVNKLNIVSNSSKDLAKQISQQEDNIKKLRETILQLAVQGKLTESWRMGHPDIISPTILLDKIDKNRKALPAIADADIPYVLPNNWNWFRIGEAINIIGGSQPPKGKFVYKPMEGYTRLVQIRDFKSDKNKVYVPSELATRPFNEDDIMIGRYGPPVFQILRGLSGTYNVALMKATPISQQLIKDFLFYLLKEPRIQKIIIEESGRTAGQSGLRKPLLDSIVFALPPLEEQHEIVSRVNQLMQRCDQLEEQVKQSKEDSGLLMQAVLKEAFEGKEALES